MLDTNIVSDMARNPTGGPASRLSALGWEAVCMSVVVASELRFGLARNSKARYHGQVCVLLDAIAIEPFDVPADAAYARLRAELQAAGQPIGPNDYFIAAHALALGLPLVTANVGEFSRVPGLHVENWLA